jgi:putative (di)nucleoside polyphosphate hydrolase
MRYLKKRLREIHSKKEYRPVGSFVVKNKENKFLIAESSKSNNFWGFPQGGIKKNESLKKNIERELKEEFGIKKTEIKILKEGIYIKRLDIPEAK